MWLRVYTFRGASLKPTPCPAKTTAPYEPFFVFKGKKKTFFLFFKEKRFFVFKEKKRFKRIAVGEGSWRCHLHQGESGTLGPPAPIYQMITH